jgi:hypothetical protein
MMMMMMMMMMMTTNPGAAAARHYLTVHLCLALCVLHRVATPLSTARGKRPSSKDSDYGSENQM